MAIVKGKSRGNGAQLARYLENTEENEHFHVLDIQGTNHPKDLKKSLTEMSLTSELTKGKHGLYHVQFSPEMGFDRRMPPREWLKAAQIIEKHLRLVGQKRVIVLHEKEGRIHGHMVWERYNHATGKLIPMSKNYEKHDKARGEIEKVLSHNRTYQRSTAPVSEKLNRLQEKKDHKKELTKIWHNTKDGASFVKEAQKAGYKIAVGQERPWRVVTPDGKDLNLVKQLDKGINTKEVGERLNPIRKELPSIQQAINPVKDAENSKQEEQKLIEKKELTASKNDKNAGQKESNTVGQKEILARQAQENYKDLKEKVDPEKMALPSSDSKQNTGEKEIESDGHKEVLARQATQNYQDIQEKQQDKSLPELMKEFEEEETEKEKDRQKLLDQQQNNEREITERERDMREDFYRQMQQNMKY